LINKLFTQLKIQQDVHFLVKQADNIDHLPGDEIEHHMLTMRKAVIAIGDIFPPPATLGFSASHSKRFSRLF